MGRAMGGAGGERSVNVRLDQADFKRLEKAAEREGKIATGTQARRYILKGLEADGL